MNKIYVTQPTLPPLDEFIPYLEEIWRSKIVTNGGLYHEKLESALCEYLGVKHVSLFANATIALVVALKALEITGKVITTPFSFIATSHSLLWNGLTPIFVDIDPATYNIDPLKIESAITEDTSAILAVHCYGNPCNVDAIERIARKHNLKVIYDAAHAFGVKVETGSVMNYGDLSVCSFHATKVFNTFEGGCIVSQSLEIKNKIDRLKNFGHNGESMVELVGINGKMSEFNAALGLLQLEYLESSLLKRRLIDEKYRGLLGQNSDIGLLDTSKIPAWNYSYFPILVDSSFRWTRDELRENLAKDGIITRRYFSPTITSFSMYSGLKSAARSNLPIANDIADRILCLPIYPDLEIEVVEHISAVINQS